MEYAVTAGGILLVAAVYKALKNAWNVRKIRRYQREHWAYVKQYLNGGAEWDFAKKVPEIKALVLKAGVADQYLSWMEPLGMMHAQHKKMSVLDNLAFMNEDVQKKAVLTLKLAEGIFESRLRESFSPFYWVETIIHIPSRTLHYLGVPDTSAWLRIANVIGWLATVGGLILSLPDFVNWQKKFSEMLSAIMSFLS